MEKYHTVVQGEYISSIARQYNIYDYRLILDHPENSWVKQNRSDPNVLYPGDRLFIPEPELKSENCQTERKHCFVLKRPKQLLRIVVLDFENQKLIKEDYALKVIAPDGKEHLYEGQTDGSGLLEQEIPIGTEYGELKVERLNYFWTLRIGHLDPLEDKNKAINSGILARLNNLGFGAQEGAVNVEIKAAVRAFQEKVLGRANASGEADQETINALLKEHGC